MFIWTSAIWLLGCIAIGCLILYFIIKKAVKKAILEAKEETKK